MMAVKPSIVIVGAGIGGLAAAAGLVRLGFNIEVYEQAEQFAPIGAGIQLTANAMKALGGFGLVEPLRSEGFVPSAFHSREWDTADVTNALVMGKSLEQRYGAPDLMIHRARLHSALAALTPRECIHFGKKLIAIEHNGSGAAALTFADGSRVEAGLVIGADGIHSVVREALFGAEQPRFTGRVAYRTTSPTALRSTSVPSGGVQTVIWCITLRPRARTRSTSSRLRQSRTSRLSPGQRGATKICCWRPLLDFTQPCALFSRRRRVCANGLLSSAILCRPGGRMRSCCSAMRAIR
jgi:2-polyprenyl-6-methoxyphenol hydroxylase-like FAD-dependent oxidoreductase